MLSLYFICSQVLLSGLLVVYCVRCSSVSRFHLQLLLFMPWQL